MIANPVLPLASAEQYDQQRKTMFVRFTLNRQDERSGADEGIFAVAYRESENNALAGWEREWLEELIAWFKKEVKVPPPLEEDQNRHAICWFKEESEEVISKAWELATFLKERGYYLDVIRTDSPGFVIYDDRHQVAARPFPAGITYHLKSVLARGDHTEAG